MVSSARKGDDRAAVLQRGFADARQVFNQHFAGYRWLLSNLSAEKHADINVILAFLIKALAQLGQPPQGHAPAANWEKLRDELRNALVQQSKDPLSCCVIDVAERNSIAKQWMFDMLDGVDLWIRFGGFRSFDTLTQFACKTGGSAMMAIVCVLEVERPGFEELAAGAGQAIGLTQVLVHSHAALRRGRCLLPSDELKEQGISLDETQPQDQRQPFCRMVRSFAARIEQEFYESAALLHHVSFDGQRVLKSLFALHWELLNHLKQDPLSVLRGRTELSRREMAVLRLKHLLGTEGSGVPIVAAAGPASEFNAEWKK
jgi:phytoene/squalene synthetase